MQKTKEKILNQPEERTFKPRTGRGKEESLTGKKRSFYGEIKYGMNRNGSGGKLGGGLKRGRGVSPGKGDKFRQRVTVKVRFQKHGKESSLKSLKLHISYLSRDGVDKDGGKAILFNHDSKVSREKLSSIAESWVQDRHHFRLVISPERGEDLDMKRYTHQFVSGLEQDLGTKLEWIGAVHYDTENPHIHLLVRGKTDTGEDLVIKSGYISYGMRDLAEELATRTLGKRTEAEIRHSLIKEVEQERLCDTDRKLLYEVSKSEKGVIDLSKPWNTEDKLVRGLKIKRLKFLRERGLSKKIAPGIWQLSETLEEVLKELSLEGDIIKTMHQRMRGERENISFKPGYHPDIKGKIIYRGFVEALSEKSYMLIEGDDGKNYSVRLSKFSEREGEEGKKGDLVLIATTGFGSRKIDEVVAEIAQTKKGEITPDSALEYLSANEKLRRGIPPELYYKNIERRLSTLSRKGIVKEEDSGWIVPSDLKEQVRNKTDYHVKVTVERKKEQEQGRESSR